MNNQILENIRQKFIKTTEQEAIRRRRSSHDDIFSAEHIPWKVLKRYKNEHKKHYRCVIRDINQIKSSIIL